MNLSEKDKNHLVKKLKYKKEDIPQIEKCLKKTRFELEKTDKSVSEISAADARKILGDDKFLSGMGRSSFHSSSVRQTEDGSSIYFDSSRFFK